MLHLDGLHCLAVHLERAGAGTAEAAHVVEGEGAQAETVILEIKLQRVLAGREGLRALPLDALEVDQIPQEHRLALEQVEAVAGKAPARGQDHALGATFGDRDVRRDGVGAVEQEGRITLRESHHRPGVDVLRTAGSDIRARRDDPRGHRGIQREDLVFLRFRDELLSQLRHLLRMLGGDVVGLAEIPGQVVELEHLVVERIRVRLSESLPGCAVDLGAQQPAVVVQRPLAHHLEILGFVARRHFGVGGVEGVEEARAFDERLFDAIDELGRGDAGGLEDSGHDVDHVDELLAQSAPVLDTRRPGHQHVLVDATEPGSVLLEPVERRVEGSGPSGRHVVVGLLGAPDVVELHLNVDGQLTEAIEECDLVGRAERAALGAGAVVAVDVDDQGVVEQDAADGGLVLDDDAVIARETRGLLGDHAEARRVMVAPGDERSTRRRAQRRGEHAVVTQTLVCDAVHGRRRDHPAESARHAEAGIIRDDEQHVGCALRRHHPRRPPGLRFQGVILDHAAELRLGRGQLLAADRGGGAGRTQLTGNLLGHGRQGRKCDSDQNDCYRDCYESFLFFHVMLLSLASGCDGLLQPR